MIQRATPDILLLCFFLIYNLEFLPTTHVDFEFDDQLSITPLFAGTVASQSSLDAHESIHAFMSLLQIRRHLLYYPLLTYIRQ
jgi:hypothetical protein